MPELLKTLNGHHEDDTQTTPRKRPSHEAGFSNNWNVEADIVAKLCSYQVILPSQWYPKPLYTIPKTLDQKLAWALLKYSIADCTTGSKKQRLKYIAEIERWLANANDPIYTSEYWVEMLGLDYSFFIRRFKRWLFEQKKAILADKIKNTPKQNYPKTCKKGHIVDGDNIASNGASRGLQCKICARERAKINQAKYRLKLKEGEGR